MQKRATSFALVDAVRAKAALVDAVRAAKAALGSSS